MGIASEFAPAKINLFLAVTGRRPDGYHDLVSVVATLDWGDRLRAHPQDTPQVECSVPGIPLGEDNLVMKAARAYAAAGGKGSARFVLKKELPMGAGLGGGSSDAVAALTALERLSPAPLGPEVIRSVAAGLGSDCPLFLSSGPVIMRGRGERLAPCQRRPRRGCAAGGSSSSSRVLAYRPRGPTANWPPAATMSRLPPPRSGSPAGSTIPGPRWSPFSLTRWSGRRSPSTSPCPPSLIS